MEIITSKSNEKVKFIKSLNEKKFRQKYMCFYLEGIKVVNEVLNSNRAIDIKFIALSSEILKKEANAISEVDIALSKAKALNKYCTALLATINKSSMKRPSVRSTKAVATTTLIATYFMRKLLKGRFIRKRKKIKKVDYSKYMENNLADIENAIELIKEASNKLDDLIVDIKVRFSEYLYLKEFQDLLSNLEEIKSNISEKEYEINNIKSNYVNGLNNQKVK